MTTPAPDPTTALTVELAHLREAFGRLGENVSRFGQDLSEIKTACAVLVERTTRTDADVRQLRADMEAELQRIRDEEVKPLRAKVDALEDRRFPLPVIGALTGVGALLATVIGLLLTR